jgi:hypothetical protein
MKIFKREELKLKKCQQPCFHARLIASSTRVSNQTGFTSKKDYLPIEFFAQWNMIIQSQL